MVQPHAMPKRERCYSANRMQSWMRSLDQTRKSSHSRNRRLSAHPKPPPLPPPSQENIICSILPLCVASFANVSENQIHVWTPSMQDSQQYEEEASHELEDGARPPPVRSFRDHCYRRCFAIRTFAISSRAKYTLGRCHGGLTGYCCIFGDLVTDARHIHPSMSPH